MRGSIYQFQPTPFFQGSDTTAERWLRDVTIFGRTGKIQRFGQGLKIGQPNSLHPIIPQ
jgi:hypothetical protein